MKNLRNKVRKDSPKPKVETAAPKELSATAMSRIQGDIANFDGMQGTTLIPNGSDFTKFKIVVKPNEGPYVGGTFLFEGHFPEDYPMSPPKVLITQRVFHPNLDYQGNICLSILRESWTPVQTLSSVADGLLFLMQYPNDEDPLDPEAGRVMRESRTTFEEVIKSTMRGGVYDGKEYTNVLTKAAQ